MDFWPDIPTSDESLQYYFNDFDEDFFHETFNDIWENCVVESIKSIYNSLSITIYINLGFGLATSLGLPENIFHWLSALCGFYILIVTLQSAKGLAVIFISYLTIYVIIFVINTFHKRLKENKLKEYDRRNKYFHFVENSSIAQYSLIIFFVLFEYILLEKETWLEIRGIMMVFSMKLISIITDIDLQNFPSFSQYCGYMFSGSNILFGPWITYDYYLFLIKYPTKKNIYWLLGIVRALFLALFFLTVSNCWTSYFIPDDSNKLLLGYKEALSFRTSHYFICYLSEALMLAAGWKEKDHHFDEQYWKLSVTNPLNIELPSALSIVVINWNKPMHYFFKKYIYRKWLPLGKFYAIFLTFLISSLFHGFEIKISLVLLSLGIFSYLQILVREQVSQTFNICVKVYPLLHLIFLGVLMDESTNEIGIYTKWSNLYFFSLWIMFINFLIVK
ncbi:hypothetical protein GWI33_019638 [Rhynchophorus ferrugineus]|uniref:Protein-serine O-palmitoleoyltransferase porcupine n=1 Tax=Rhynchophorus ferrugineus TaxID=354439 RepID=A0A834I523_RHYFE|nr:hypothetical protein GWI33_019638 [Rhynchophorus ferrugineus]